jgi:hypothetical protein
MAKLINMNESESEQLLNSLFNEELIVLEDIQGSKIWVNWNGTEFMIKPKSLSSEPINLVDLAMQNYYNPGVEYFKSLDTRVKSLLNKKWWFCFEYFPDNQPANIEYDRIPKNGLVITGIHKSGKYDFNIEELAEYARLIDVEMIPVVFQGRLTERMIEAIKYFLNTSEDDLEYVFGEKNFTFFFYKMLNPATESSFLMNGDFQRNVEKLIFRLTSGDTSFELLNPLYKRVSETNSTDFVEIYTLILINFLNFCQSIQIRDVKIRGNNREELYLSLVCRLYNLYLAEVKEDLLDFEFTIPEFFDKDKFRINKSLVDNRTTKEYLEENSKLEYIFKVILGSFNKKKKRPIGVFTDSTVSLFNRFVDDLSGMVDEHLGRASEVELARAGLLDFGDFFDIKYDTDAAGEVYPDVYSEIEAGTSDKKKKKPTPGGKPEIGEKTI